MCFVLLPDKRESTYSKMFCLLIKSFTEEQHPLKIYHDFEKASLNPIAKWLPSTKIEGCYFQCKTFGGKCH